MLGFQAVTGFRISATLGILQRYIDTSSAGRLFLPPAAELTFTFKVVEKLQKKKFLLSSDYLHLTGRTLRRPNPQTCVDESDVNSARGLYRSNVLITETQQLAERHPVTSLRKGCLRCGHGPWEI